MTLFGVDISNNNGACDFALMAANGVRFAFIKASEGTYFADPYFQANWKNAAANGILRAAYHFARPDASTPEAEAAWFVECVGQLVPGDLLALDIEDGSGDLSGWCERFLAAVTARVGFKPLIYTAPYFMTAHNLLVPALAEYGLWLASWGPTAPAAPSPWAFWACWQYSAQGTVPGIAGDVDMDVWNGSEEQWHLYGMAQPAPPPVVEMTANDKLQAITLIIGSAPDWHADPGGATAFLKQFIAAA